jgi:hypothetical protein
MTCATLRPVLAIALLVGSIATTVAGCSSCPTGRIDGVLVADGSDLSLQIRNDGTVKVVWPRGSFVRTDGDHPVVTDIVGVVIAREGDWIQMSGEFGADGLFVGCGPVGLSAR